MRLDEVKYCSRLYHAAILYMVILFVKYNLLYGWRFATILFKKPNKIQVFSKPLIYKRLRGWSKKRPGISLKCASLVNNFKPCWNAIAAIQISFVGTGLPVFLRLINYPAASSGVFPKALNAPRGGEYDPK